MEKNDDKNTLSREEMKNIKGGLNPQAELKILPPKKIEAGLLTEEK